MKDVVLVVPSIREESWNRFVKEWNGVGLFEHVDVILMEDNPKRTFKAEIPGADVFHYDWESITTELGEDEWIIPRRSDTVRSFGYLMAWKMRNKYKYVLTLDDDCYPPTEKGDGFTYKGGADGFIQMHKDAIEKKPAWFNTLTSVKPRGIPFYGTGAMNNIVINHGLWTHVLDYDAPTQLVQPTKEKFAFDNRVVPMGQYFPMCGMNVMWKNAVTVLMYHLLMGRSVRADVKVLGNDQLQMLPFDRFGDIWCGIIAKKLCDVAGLAISSGTPYIHHDRASNPFANLKKEANGLEVNEKLWKYVDSFRPEGTITTLTELYGQMGQHVSKYNEFPEYKTYFQSLGKAMEIWANLLKVQ